MCKIAFSILLAVFLSGAAMAQIPTKGNIFFGYSYANTDVISTNRSSLNGWNGSLEGKVLPWVGIVGDFSGLYGSQDVAIGCPGACTVVSADAREHNFLFGPRVSFSVGKVRPFAHALFGAAHISASAAGFSDSDTSLGLAVGGGFDYHLVPAFAWRVQADMLQTRFFSDTQNNFRFSTGLVFSF